MVKDTYSPFFECNSVFSSFAIFLTTVALSFQRHFSRLSFFIVRVWLSIYLSIYLFIHLDR